MFNPFSDERRKRDDFERLFSSTLGRRVLAEIINMGVVSRAHITVQEKSLFVLEGRRSLALDIFELAGGARRKLGQAYARDDIGEAFDESNAHRPTRTQPGADPDESGESGEPLFAAADPAGAILADGD